MGLRFLSFETFASSFHLFPPLYGVRQVVVDLDWVDLELGVPLYSLATKLIMSSFQLPKQNVVGSGMPKIYVNTTQVHDHQPLPCKSIVYIRV